MVIPLIDNISEDIKIIAVKECGYAIECIKDPSESIQIEAIKNFSYNYFNNDYFVERYVKSPKAKELYFKLKKIKEIIK